MIVCARSGRKEANVRLKVVGLKDGAMRLKSREGPGVGSTTDHGGYID